MKRVAKISGFFLLTVVSMLIVAMLVYDVVWFQPNQKPIRAVLSNLDPECAEPPSRFVDLMKAAYFRPLVIEGNVARYGIGEAYSGYKNLPLGWHSDSMLWSVLIYLHYSEEEKMSILCSVLWNGEDRGLNAYSLRRYDRPLSELDVWEMAIVVSIPIQPNYYKNNPERHETRARDLMVKAGLEGVQ